MSDRSHPMRIHVLHLVAVFVAVLVGCTRPGDASPVLKIGLIAPFEGLGRSMGYAALGEVKGELALANEARRFGRYKVALVAVNDNSDGRSAAFQAQALAQDRDVLAVIGPWTTVTAQGAAPVLAAAGIPSLVAGVVEPGLDQIWPLCPPASEIAAAMVSAGKRSGVGHLVIAGPDNPLARALEQAAPDALRVASPTQDASQFCAKAAMASVYRGHCRATVLYTGDAAQGADDLVRWRSSGWRGALLGGPDLAALPSPPWGALSARAGAAAEGAQAVVCTLPGELGSKRGDDASPEALSTLAEQSAKLIIDAIAQDVAIHDRPSRPGVQAALAEHGIRPGLTWIRCVSGAWQAGGQETPKE